MMNANWPAGKWPATAALLAISAIASAPGIAIADQGGISFWLPGIFGSLAAVPGVPGLSFQSLYVHTSVGTNAGKTFPLNGQIVAGLKGGGNLAAFGPTYIFETPVLGGQAALSVLGIGGERGFGIGDADRAARQHDLGDRDRLADGVWRRASDGVAQMERRSEQLHDLPDRRHSGWRV